MASWLSRLGSIALPMGASALTSRFTGKGWGAIDPRKPEGEEGFLSLAKTGLGALQAAEEEERRRKWQKRQEREDATAGLIGALSPRVSYQPKRTAAPAPSALERIGQYGGMGVGAVQTARVAQREREKAQREKELSTLNIEKGKEEAAARAAEAEAIRLAGQIGSRTGQPSYTALKEPEPGWQIDPQPTFADTAVVGEDVPPEMYTVEKYRAEKPFEEGTLEEKYFGKYQEGQIRAWHTREQERIEAELRVEYTKAKTEAERRNPEAYKRTAGELQAAAKVWARRNPYAPAIGLKTYLQSKFNFTEEQIEPFLAEAELASIEMRTKRQEIVKGIVNKAVAQAADANAEVALKNARALLGASEIDVSPEVMDAIADALNENEKVLKLGGDAQGKLASVLFLEQELGQLVKYVETHKEEIASEFGPLGAGWQAVQGFIDGEEGLSEENLQLVRRLQFSSDMLARMQSGAALNDQEFQRYFKELLGSVSTDPEELLVNLKTMRINMIRRKEGILNAARLVRGIELTSELVDMPSGHTIEKNQFELLLEIAKNEDRAYSDKDQDDAIEALDAYNVSRTHDLKQRQQADDTAQLVEPVQLVEPSADRTLLATLAPSRDELQKEPSRNELQKKLDEVEEELTTLRESRPWGPWQGNTRKRKPMSEENQRIYNELEGKREQILRALVAAFNGGG